MKNLDDIYYEVRIGTALAVLNLIGITLNMVMLFYLFFFGK